MLAQHFCLVHFYHALPHYMITPVTFYQLAAPLMLLSTGEDYAKGTPFLASMVNLMQLMYMYSLAYRSIRFTCILAMLPCVLTLEATVQSDLSVMRLPEGTAESDSHLGPTLHDCQLAPSCTVAAPYASGLCICRTAAALTVQARSNRRNRGERVPNKST